MLDIYLCDDEEQTRELIRSLLQQKIMIEDYDMQVVLSAGDPGSLLRAVRSARQKRNIYFLDVELKDGKYDGFLLGREIRREDPHATLVYITGFGDLAYRTFQYHLEAFDYITKEPEKLAASISHCLESLHAKMLEEKKDVTNVYSVKCGDTVKHIPVQDILFFETGSQAHHVILNTENSRIDFVGNLNEIEKQMGEGFLRIHRSYLAALEKVNEIDLRHNRVIVGGLSCLVSRKMKSKLLEKMCGDGSRA